MATLSQRAFRAYVRAPDHPAKLRLVRWLWPWFVPAQGVLCDIDDRQRMWLHPEDAMEGSLFSGQGYETATCQFLDANLAAGSVALFAGANTGFHLIRAGRRVGETGKVVGVEPQPLCLYRARRNIEENKLANIVLVAAGLGDKDGIVPMGPAPEHNTGWASFVLRDPGETPFHVSVWKYDNLLDHLQLPSVDLMLLDVEGFELSVLQGMSPARAPSILLIEVHPKVLELLAGNESTYYEILSGMGYSTWTLNGQRAQPGTKLPDNNLVCVKEGCHVPVWSANNSDSSHP
jgi:FkbM family methyltransferase